MIHRKFSFWQKLDQLTKRGRYSLQMLEKLKNNGVKAIILDYDGTLYDKNHPQYGHNSALDLVFLILKKRRAVGIFSSRFASFERLLYPRLLRRQDRIDVPLFFGGGNGSRLTVVQKGKREVLYDYGLTDTEIKKITDEIFRSTNIKDLNEEGIEIFRKMLVDDWGEYIDFRFIDMAAKYQGVLFIEQPKVSFVLPKNQSNRQELINSLKKKLGNHFTIAVGDDIFAHITKKLKKDGKLLGVQTMMQCLGITDLHIGAFGNMPRDNDRAMLSSLSFGFTNDFEFEKRKLESPPYVLPRSNPPVESIYKATRFLIA